MIEIVELSKITADESAQPRCAIDVDRVAEYIEDMDRGDKFPPLVVFKSRPTDMIRTYWLADGFHRFYAAVNAALRQVECDVREGGLRDAVLYSCGANAQHGARRTNEDKRRAVSRMLLDEEWATWSDREIGRRCCVDHKLVAAIRRELGNDTGEIPSTERTFTHSRKGGPASMDTSNIGKSLLSGELDGPLIGKCLREIERYMDMMPTPNDAVHHFPEDQYYLFPISKIESMAQWLASFAASWRAKIVEKARGAA